MNCQLKCLAFLACLLAVQSYAQTADDLAAAQARYKTEVAECAVTNPVVDNSNCVKEARNTLAEIKRGRMSDSSLSSDFEKNALLRCDVHKDEDKSNCIARIHGQGRIEGSVAGGGILRELTTTKVITSPPIAQPEPTKALDVNRPSGLMSNCRWVPPLDWVCR
jgi:hypothetical protein